MKKIIYCGLFISAIVLQSCTSEDYTETPVTDQRTEHVKEFREALRSLNSPENRATPEEKRQNSTELSDRRKMVLVPAAKSLILSTGISEQELNDKTNGDITKIIVWALDIYTEKNREINTPKTP